MSEILKNFIYFFILWQEKLKIKKYNNVSTVSDNKSSKTILTESYSLNFNAEVSKNKDILENEIINILKSLNNDIKNLLSFINENKTPVIRRKNAKKILDIVRENQGYLYELSGIKAFFLNLFLFKKISFRTNEMFLLDSSEEDEFLILYQFYRWYAFKKNMPGYNVEAQENLKKYTDERPYLNINALNVDEILNLKSAVARDVEAIDFVEKFITQINKKLTDGETSI